MIQAADKLTVQRNGMQRNFYRFPFSIVNISIRLYLSAINNNIKVTGLSIYTRKYLPQLYSKYSLLDHQKSFKKGKFIHEFIHRLMYMCVTSRMAPSKLCTQTY